MTSSDLTRTCTGCGKDKPLDSEHFYRKGKGAKGQDLYESVCIECRKRQTRRRENPETKASYQRALYRLRDRHPREFRQILKEERKQ